MPLRRLGNWRPVGAVDCPRCGETRRSGGYQQVVIHGERTERKLMCDRCRETFRRWYNRRADEQGWVRV